MMVHSSTSNVVFWTANLWRMNDCSLEVPGIQSINLAGLWRSLESIALILIPTDGFKPLTILAVLKPRDNMNRFHPGDPNLEDCLNSYCLFWVELLSAGNTQLNSLSQVCSKRKAVIVTWIKNPVSLNLELFGVGALPSDRALFEEPVWGVVSLINKVADDGTSSWQHCYIPSSQGLFWWGHP